jgi:UDP-N-acetylmuramoylalanine--D-glutamate ligase
MAAAAQVRFETRGHGRWRTREDRIDLVADTARGKTLIVGLGETGAAAASYLASRGEDVLAVDSRAAPPGLDELRRSHPEVPVVLESLDPQWLAGVDRVVLSPGLALEIPLVASARAQRIPVVSDIELFAQAAQAPVLAVTGSNGKSTVVTLAAEMLRAQGLSAHAGGNLGPAALALLALPTPDAYVLEISSFQMETTESLHPRGATVLNVSADHLDRHGSLTAYAALKAKLLDAATDAVFNWDDAIVREMGLGHRRATPFSVTEALKSGYSMIEHNGSRWFACDLEPLMPATESPLIGRHNEANVLAAFALTALFGGERAAAIEAVRHFRGLPHRCVKVAELDSITYVDDSKGTNVGAAVAALTGIDGPVVLIAGGIGKGADFAPLAAAAAGKVRATVLIGRDAPALARAFAGVCPTLDAATMPQAVELATAAAEPGDTVLLSPACASQDMFRDYRDRGDAFARAVEELRR